MSRRSIRWWPAILITGVMIAILAGIWLSDIASTQHKVIPTFPTLFFGVLLLFLWLVLFSRLPGRTRWRIFVVVVCVVGLGFATLEIKGVTGNLVPIVGWRWSGEPSFESGELTETEGEPLRPQPAATDGGVAGQYSQFYGPNRLASLEGPVLARDWQAQPPREIWRRPVGEGWSSFAIVGEAAITQEQREGHQVVVRYHLDTGEQIWVHTLGDAFDTTVAGRGPRATPTIVGKRVFALDATGNLAALDVDSGQELWLRNVLTDHNAGQPSWGMASSPLVVDDRVMVQLGKNGTGLAAYDIRTGDPIWRVGDDSGTYSSPLASVVLGQPMVLSVNRTSMTGQDPVTGELLLLAQWPNDVGGERITMPLLIDRDRILVSAGYGVGSRLFSIHREGARFSATVVWDSPRLKSKFAPMVLFRGVVYGLDDGVLVALDPGNGERFWKGGRYGHGQIVRIGELLLIQAESGDLVLVEATPEEHRELARVTPLDSKTWNPPAVVGRRVLLRNNLEAVCLDLPLAG